MSGGSFDYGYLGLERYIGKMKDRQLNKMIKDLAEVLHDLEWYVDADISEEDYRKTVTKFKKKWFNQTDDDINELIVEEFTEVLMQVKKELEYLKK